MEDITTEALTDFIDRRIEQFREIGETNRMNFYIARKEKFLRNTIIKIFAADTVSDILQNYSTLDRGREDNALRVMAQNQGLSYDTLLAHPRDLFEGYPVSSVRLITDADKTKYSPHLRGDTHNRNNYAVNNCKGMVLLSHVDVVHRSMTDMSTYSGLEVDIIDNCGERIRGLIPAQGHAYVSSELANNMLEQIELKKPGSMFYIFATAFPRTFNNGIDSPSLKQGAHDREPKLLITRMEHIDREDPGSLTIDDILPIVSNVLSR